MEAVGAWEDPKFLPGLVVVKADGAGLASAAPEYASVFLLQLLPGDGSLASLLAGLGPAPPALFSCLRGWHGGPAFVDDDWQGCDLRRRHPFLTTSNEVKRGNNYTDGKYPSAGAHEEAPPDRVQRSDVHHRHPGHHHLLQHKASLLGDKHGGDAGVQRSVWLGHYEELLVNIVVHNGGAGAGHLRLPDLEVEGAVCLPALGANYESNPWPPGDRVQRGVSFAELCGIHRPTTGSPRKDQQGGAIARRLPLGMPHGSGDLIHERLAGIFGVCHHQETRYSLHGNARPKVCWHICEGV
mmetsp:Transcript_5115/g.14281  ORF Transcript_5115/g.14281 Transcript_5115/m.14281 type:complete len:297 (+) Transcript_5115:391-1281(+)